MTEVHISRDRIKKDLAWKSVIEEIGQAEDVCRKKWKILREMYLKEKQMEMEKRSESAAWSGKRWKYSQILGFLDPFVAPQETSNNMEGVEAQIREDNHPEDQGQSEEPSGETVTELTDEMDPEAGDGRSSAASPVSTVPGPSPCLLNPQANRGGDERSQDASLDVENKLTMSANEHFLLSLLPFRQSMLPHRK